MIGKSIVNKQSGKDDYVIMKRNIKKWRVMFMVLVMACCILTACGSGGHGDPSEMASDPIQTDIPEILTQQPTQSSEASEEMSLEEATSEATEENSDRTSVKETASPEPKATEMPEQTQQSASADKEKADASVKQTEVPASSRPTATPVPTPAPTPAATPAPTPAPTPVHTHSWTETGRSESTDCFKGVTTTSISYSCGCGETKTETQTAASGCDWQWTGDWHYDNSGCVKSRVTHHICVVHGTMTNEAPQFEEVDEHAYSERRIEPDCETRGEVIVVCDKCGTHFPDKSGVITTDKYPDGGGNGHQWAETSRRDLSQEEASWYGENKVCVTYTCSVCGFSYDDIVDK